MTAQSSENLTGRRALTTHQRTDEGPATIQSVERAARILDFFTVSRPRLSLSEITARLGMSKATAHRYAMALRHVNLLRYDAAVAEYTLGPQVLVLAAAARAGLPIIRLAGPLMEQLVREVNETVVLSVWDGEAPVVVRVDDGTERVIRVSVRAGSRLEPFTSAQGRVFCAFLPDDAVPGLADELASSDLGPELTKIAEAGVAVNMSEVHGVRTVAAPVFADGRIVAVMALVGTTATLADGPASRPARALERTSRRLSEIYGRHGIGDDPEHQADGPPDGPRRREDGPPDGPRRREDGPGGRADGKVRPLKGVAKRRQPR